VQLTVRDVSECLNVSEAMVARWVRQRGLPSRLVAGQHRFNRIEVLEWATANQISVSSDVFDDMDSEEEPIPTLAESLTEGGIVYQLPATTREEALRALMPKLPLPDETDRELLLHLFLAREATASTALGDGIAIPHVRNPIVLQVVRPIVTLAFLAEPVDFGAPDGKPVHILFSIISPTTQSHLRVLSRLSYVLHDSAFRKTLIRQANYEEILREVCRIESGLAEAEGRVGRVAS
jgi:nitrogen PTS system EIIA component